MTELRSKLARKVEKAILEDRRTGQARINVVDDDGILTLTGTVKDKRVSETVEEIARQFEGVLDVINNIDVVNEDLTLAGTAGIPPHPPSH
jgi:osmotically-inducible protein OsmY